jgi:hypothetical protein
MALIIDQDFGFLDHAASRLLRAGYQVRTRLSPSGLRTFISSLRPEVILLGVPFWELGWAAVLRSCSPDSIVFPVAPQSGDPGVADLHRLPSLLTASRPSSRKEEEHAA